MDKFVTWDIKDDYDHCWWKDDDWCDHQKKRCTYDICPLKVKGSHGNTDVHGKTLEKIK